MRNLLLVAGEASGDLYGAELARELHRLDPRLKIWGCGGERMRREGVEIIYSNDQFAVLGFAEVVSKLPFFYRALSHMKRLVSERRPAVAVPIDYPGFNMRLAAHCACERLPVVYYVSPQIWAWGWNRVKRIRRLVSRMIVILPFEADIYRREGVPAQFAGHPLIDLAQPTLEPDEFRYAFDLPAQNPIIGLFPGSRSQEVEALLPVMAAAARRLKEEDYSIVPVVGAAPTLDDRFYENILGDQSIPVIRENTYNILKASLFAFVASGTMTVEAACVGTPMAILYRVAPLSWLLGRLLVRVPHVGMVNILAGERIVPELLQGAANVENLLPIGRRWLESPASLTPIQDKLRAVRKRLGRGGASRRAAEAILETADRAR